MIRLHAMLWTSHSNFRLTQVKTQKQDLPSHTGNGELRRRS
jgi:hypothetical protein